MGQSRLAQGTQKLTNESVNLGKWILRYLFANLIDEEIFRDENYRRQLVSQSRQSRNIQRSEAPPSIQLPTLDTRPWLDERPEEDSQITPRAPNGNEFSVVTPGLVIGIATPHPGNASNNTLEQSDQPAYEEGARLEKNSLQQTQSRASSDKSGEYFSTNPNASASSAQHARPSTPGEDSSGASTQSPVDGEKEEKPKEGTTLFGGVGKRFRMNFPKKLGRTSVEVRPTVIDDKAEESDKSEEREERIIQDNFFGTIQKLRYDYEERLQANPPQPLVTTITPSLLNETPLLKLPLHTTIIIQEDQPDSGGVADLYRGTVRSAGHDADLIEQFGPMWLGDLLLRACLPNSFTGVC